jgi:transcriptional regulator with XRE-family HTH domain
LAARLEVSGATLSLIVNGHRIPGSKVLRNFANALSDPALPNLPAPGRARSDGKPLVALARATTFRENLELAGLTRPQLYELTDSRRHIVIHDLRATFVTVSLAEGKSEAWITDRTGHTSSSMLYRYKRTARTHQERALGSLTPLALAIPELAKLAQAKSQAPTQTPSLADSKVNAPAPAAISAAYTRTPGVRTMAPAPGLEPYGGCAGGRVGA